MSGILDKLRALKTSVQFGDAIPQLETAETEAKGRIGKLREKKEAAIFEGSADDLQSLRDQIRIAEENLEEIQIALEGAKRRREQAADRELERKVRARIREAAKIKEEQRKNYVRFHELASELGPLKRKIREMQQNMFSANQYARDNGYGDLCVKSHIADLAKALGKEVRDPTYDVEIFYYTGNHDPENSPLAKLK